MSNPLRMIDFDGLVVESANGDRILALPTVVLESLRYASVIRYKRGASVWNLRLDGFTDGRDCAGTTQARDDIADAVHDVQADAAEAASSAAANPSPTPPPAAVNQEEPADIPIRVRRDGAWYTIYVTRAQYEEYERQGRISQEPPADEGTTS